MTDRYLGDRRQAATAAIGGCALLLGFYLRTGDPLLLLFLVSALVADSCWLTVREWPTKRQGAARQAELETRIILLACASGAAYGAGAYRIFSPEDAAGNALLLVGCTAGMSSVAASTYWLIRVSIGWCALFAGVVTIRLALEASPLYNLVAMWVPFYAVLQIMFAARTHRVQAESIGQVILNEQLASRLEEQARRAQAASERADQASKEKSRFLAAASHDLRQPLHAVCLLTDSIRRQPSSAEQDEQLRRLAGSVAELADTVEAVLDISGMDAGDYPARIEPVSVAQLIAVLHGRYSARAAGKGLSMRFFHRDQVIWADRGMMERILGNLIDNAIKYTQRGGILVGARTRRTSAEPEVVIEVRDSGSGIDPADQGHIFDEFYQVGNIARERSAGLGLGLSIVRRLAAITDVRVSLRSAPGCGSTFSVSARAAPPLQASDAPGEAEDGAAALPSLAGVRVLLVDNERPILQATMEVLLEAGAEVHGATTAEEAMDVAVRRRFDVGVFDFRLGESMNGLELARRVRDMQGANLQVLIITGDTDLARIGELPAVGTLQVLTKPLRGTALVSAVADVLPSSAGGARRPALATPGANAGPRPRE